MGPSNTTPTAPAGLSTQYRPIRRKFSVTKSITRQRLRLVVWNRRSATRTGATTGRSSSLITQPQKQMVLEHTTKSWPTSLSRDAREVFHHYESKLSPAGQLISFSLDAKVFVGSIATAPRRWHTAGDAWCCSPGSDAAHCCFGSTLGFSRFCAMAHAANAP